MKMLENTAPASPDRAEATRQRILDVALRLFRTMGYQKTAVADIARELGMSPANVYRFFPSKSAINEAIAARMLAGLEAGAWAIARGEGSATERLARLVRYLHAQEIELFFHEKRLHDMVTAAMAEHWGVVERCIRAITEAIRHVLMDGMAAGEFARLDPEATAVTIRRALMMWNHPHQVAECLARGESTETLAAALEEMIAFILRALRPDPPA
ncbi:MAG: TetR/AcrR family transcriptional regulator [Acetobacteraceae bacterium]|nr:TetR/AcrR family transcriptional regulator [Acetobacteraceae bacterium]